MLHGKGDKARVVGLDAGAWAILQLWLDKRAAAGISGRAPVFCTLQGKPVKPGYVRTLMPRLARRAGIEQRVHAHGLRHTHAFELAAKALRCTSSKPNSAIPAWPRPTGTFGT